MSYGTTYYLSVAGVNAYGTGEYSSEKSITTSPQSPSISLGLMTSTTVTINIGNISGNYSRIVVYLRNGGNLVDYETGYANSSVTFTVVTGQSYTVNADTIFDIDGTSIYNYSPSNNLNFVANPKPQPWDWSYNIQSGGAVYNTVKVGSQIIAYIVPAIEWTAFTSRINAFRVYKMLSTVNFTQVYSDSDCTAQIINEAVNAINSIGFTIPTVSAGNIPASVFINMKNALNSIQ